MLLLEIMKVFMSAFPSKSTYGEEPKTFQMRFNVNDKMHGPRGA
jgi:hypothetical protein